MSQNDPEGEAISLQEFIAARESATGELLVMESGGESPDFICSRPNGDLVGVEITQILYDHVGLDIKRVLGQPYEVDNFDVFWTAYLAMRKKEEKRKKPHWRTPENTILVLDMMEVERVSDFPDEPNDESFDSSQHGFLEIWVADHSSIEAYGRISLFGLWPRENWGLNGQEYLFGKPYG